MKTVNRKNCESANNFEMYNATNADGTPTRCRRNGKTKVWKTRPSEFKIPVKHGLYDYGYIDENNCHEFYISD